MPSRPKSHRDSPASLTKAATQDKSERHTTKAPDEGDEDVWEEVSEKRLRFADLLSELPNGDVSNATELCLPGRGFTEIDSLESCRSLKKLELKSNYVADVAFLDMNHELCWLGLAKNRLERISGLNNLASLAVLDLSDNRITRLEGLSGLAGLKALIAVRNHISKVEGLSPKKNPLLETLVLSHNRIAECNLAPFPGLKKISLANNKLHAFPGLATLPQLAELRLNGNRITALSPDIARQPRLSILDVGNNLLQRADGLEPLRGLLWLKSFNFFGNSIASDVEKEPLKSILASLTKLEILNNRRLPQAGEKIAKWKGRGRRKNNAWNESGDTNQFASTRHKPDKQKDVSPVAIHGRGFQGKRLVFEEDAPGDENTRSEGNSGAAKIRKKKKVKRVAESASVIVKAKTKKRKAPVDMSGQEGSTASCEKALPMKRKKKAVKKTSA